MSALAARLFAPASLSLEPGVDADRPLEWTELEPGDIVLLKTPGIVYEGFRKATKYQYDHVLVALRRPDHCLHISPPQARRVRSAQLLIKERDPLVLRPRLSADESTAFVTLCESLIGKEYSLSRLYSSVLRTVAEKQFRIGRFLPKAVLPTKQDPSSICTDAILVSLLEASPKIRKSAQKQAPDLDLFRTGTASVSDFIRLKELALVDEVPVLVQRGSIKEKSTTERLSEAWEEAGKRTITLRTLTTLLFISSFFNKRLYVLRLGIMLALMIGAIWKLRYTGNPSLTSRL